MGRARRPSHSVILPRLCVQSNRFERAWTLLAAYLQGGGYDSRQMSCRYAVGNDPSV